MSDRFVNAYDKDTGLKHRIPAHWLDHPTISRNWRKTPKQRATDGTNTDTSAPSVTPATDVTAISGVTTDLDSTTTPPDSPSSTDTAAEPKE